VIQAFGEVRDWTGPLAAVLGSLAAGLLVRRFVMPALARAADKTSWRLDNVLVHAIRGPILIVFLLIGLRIATRLLDVDAPTERLLARLTLIVGIFAATWAIARFAAGVTRLFAARGAVPGVSLLANIALAVVFVIGFLITLQAAGIPVTPLITALGVGGLAVGLALQDTLTNLFAGVRLLAGGQIRRGDFIRLESGQEGWVEDIAWSWSSIREGVNDLVIVPNSKLAQGVVTNFSRPEAWQLLVIALRVATDADLAKVEKIALETAIEVQKSSADAAPDHTPLVRFQDYSDLGVRFTVTLRARTYPDRGGLQHDFMKILHARYQQEGIKVPTLQQRPASSP